MKRDTFVMLLQFTTTLTVILATLVAIVFWILMPFDEYWVLFKIHITVSWMVCLIQWLVYLTTMHHDSEYVPLKLIAIYPLLTILISYHTMDSWIGNGLDRS